jgi:hypothetical protein
MRDSPCPVPEDLSGPSKPKPYTGTLPGAARNLTFMG